MLPVPGDPTLMLPGVGGMMTPGGGVGLPGGLPMQQMQAPAIGSMMPPMMSHLGSIASPGLDSTNVATPPPAPSVPVVDSSPMMMAGGGVQTGMQSGMNPMMMMPPGMGQMMMPQAGMQPMMMMTPMGPMMVGMNPMMMNPMMGAQLPDTEAPKTEEAAQNEPQMGEASAKQPSLRERLGIGPRTRPARDLVWGKNECDPQVLELCKNFQIEDRIRDRLNDVMMTREETFDSDIKALWEVCESATKPSGYLMVKISELERGVFTGAQKSDNDLTTFAQKNRLDDRCLAKMIEVFSDRQDTKRQELKEIQKRMKGVEKAQTTVVMPMLESLKRTGKFPSPERASRKKSKSRQRSPSRSSSRSRSRSESRSPSRKKSRSRKRKK